MSIVSSTNLPTLANRLAKVRVLLVDDDVEMLQLLRGLLKQLGFVQIVTATDGAEAIALLSDKKAMREQEIDLIITDWNMTPITGIELLRFVRTSSESPNQYIPVIMLSGRGEWADVEQARDAGFTEYLIKPFTAKALCDRILLCVENPRAFVSTATYKGPSRRRRDTGALPPGVEVDRRQRNSENTLPGKALKGKIGFDITMRQIFTQENVEQAQEHINSAADRFHEWVMRDVANLLHALRNARQLNNPAPYASKIRRIAFGIKSHAGMFGYDLGSQVAQSLCNACDKPVPNPAHQLLILQKHIETLQVIFHKKVLGHGDAVGEELLTSLNGLIRKCRAAPENEIATQDEE